MIWKTLLTGSRAYGTPRPDSDVDIVLRLPQEALDMLLATVPQEKVRRYPENHSVSIWYDKLNLICVTSDTVFEAWAAGTAVLMTKAPVTREAAIEEFNSRGIAKSLESQDPAIPEQVAEPINETVPF